MPGSKPGVLPITPRAKMSRVRFQEQLSLTSTKHFVLGMLESRRGKKVAQPRRTSPRTWSTNRRDSCPMQRQVRLVTDGPALGKDADYTPIKRACQGNEKSVFVVVRSML